MSGQPFHRKVTPGFLKRDGGNVALEFAAILPVILGLIFSMVDLGRLVITDTILQTTLGTLIHEHRILQLQQGGEVPTEQLLSVLHNLSENTAQGWIGETALSLTVEPLEDEAGSVFSPPSQKLFRYEVSYSFSPTTPFASSLLGAEILNRKIGAVAWQDIY